MPSRPCEALPDDLPCLVLVCKRPAMGHAKQRLASTLGPACALTLAQGLLDCALEDLHAWPGPTVIAPDHPAHLGWAGSLVSEARCLAQADGNLGQRLNALDRDLRSAGERALMFIGSDCPLLDADAYRNVHQQLQDADTVLLAARDGGVVLMASNHPWPDLAGLPWSTARLGEALAERCRDAGQQVVVAGESFDIDHAADLPPLARALADDPRPARRRLLDLLASLGHAVDA